MIIDVEEHLLVGQARALREGALEVDKVVLTGRRVRVEHVNDTMGALHDRTPSLLVAPVTRHIPEFNVDFTKDASGGGCIPFELKDSIRKCM